MMRWEEHDSAGNDESRTVLHNETILRAADRGMKSHTMGRRVWILDPMDGTKGLLTGQRSNVGLAL